MTNKSRSAAKSRKLDATRKKIAKLETNLRNAYEDWARAIAPLEEALKEISGCKHCMGTHGQRVASAAIRYLRFASAASGGTE